MSYEIMDDSCVFLGQKPISASDNTDLCNFQIGLNGAAPKVFPDDELAQVSFMQSHISNLDTAKLMIYIIH